MTEIGQLGAQPSGVFGIIEQGSHFVLGGRREDDTHETARHVDRAIHRGRGAIGKRGGSRVCRAGAEKEVSARAAASMSLRKVGGVGVDMQDHATSMEPDDRIRVRGAVVEELDECRGGVVGFGSGCKSAQRNE